jgi:CheY-like chemotaxis protein
VASSLTLVVAQRLVRRPCASCAADYTPSARTLALLGLVDADLSGATPKRGKGCADCGGTGYRGRTGVYEVLPVTAALRKVLLSTPTEAAIGTAAREHGMTTLRAAALGAAFRGETTFEEVLRATHVDTVSGPRCPTCARALADDMVCCPWDGAVLGANKCLSCEKQLDSEWAVCPWCRTPVLGFEAKDTATDERPMPRLLVIDDDESVCSFVAAALAGSAVVTRALSSEAGLNLLGTEDFDGILVDNGLPDLSGLEFIRLVRSDPKTLTLPIVLFTGATSPEVERDARHAGADDFLAKPVEPMLLEERVLSLLARETRTLPTAAI